MKYEMGLCSQTYYQHLEFARNKLSGRMAFTIVSHGDKKQDYNLSTWLYNKKSLISFSIKEKDKRCNQKTINLDHSIIKTT